MSGITEKPRLNGLIILGAVFVLSLGISLLFAVPALSSASEPKLAVAPADIVKRGESISSSQFAAATGILNVTVSPTLTQVGQPITFTITVVNTDTVPLTNTLIKDTSFTSFIDVQTVATTLGTEVHATHALTVTVGQINPSTTVTITVVAASNNTLAQTQTFTNTVNMSYGVNQSRTASVHYTVEVPPTPTSTSTATATATRTPTPTVTGTLPTPTATGTITPNPTLTVAVSPSSAKVNTSLTFTIKVTNGGKAPMTSSIIADSFPSYIDITSASTTLGTVTKGTHNLTVNIGTVMPNETVQITVIVKVNSSLTKQQTDTNTVTLTYDPNKSLSKGVNYTSIPTTVLPGTGEISLQAAARLESARQRLLWLIVIGIITGVGALMLAASLSAPRVRRILAVIGLGVLAVLAISCIAQTQPSVPVQPAITVFPPPTSTPTLLPFMPAYMFSTPEAIVTLPSFPIPTPVIAATTAPGEPLPDISAVYRIVIPALTLDTEVAYVPYDEESLTWLIAGLRQEVAWLGNTSWPGLGSNTVMAAHVTVRGQGNGPFRYLENLAVGDQVTLFTEENMYTYQVRDQISVEETDMGVTLPTTQAQLTLITCTGWDQELEIYRFRRVVLADLVRTEPMTRQGSK